MSWKDMDKINNKVTMEKEEILNEIQAVVDAVNAVSCAFERHSERHIDKENLSAGERSRKSSVNMGKLLKEYRRLSLALEKVIIEERKNKI